jgi:hypothetical protein
LNLKHAALVLVAALALLASGCDRTGHAGKTQDNGDDLASLPKPASSGGPVTGMPDTPGPGPIGADVAGAGTLPPPLPVADATLPAPDAVVAQDAAVETGVVEPSPADAVAVLGAYYDAISAGQYPRAYALWSGTGQASGQTAQQFAAGFAATADVDFEPGTPGRVDAAAGSRYIEVPVSIQATRNDGSVHRYAGIYTLRRAVVDGASAEQRAWRIASADIREVR